MNTPAGGKSANFGAPVAHMPEKSVKLKKLVFRMFLEGTYGVALRAKELSDVKADSRAGDLDDVTDLVGENVLPMLKTMNYTLSVTSWTKRRPQPLFPRGEKGGGDGSHGKRVPHDGGERDGGGESGEQFQK